ncbi:glycosyltransferase family 1 protein [Lactobacillus sp. CC-MHH1034]|nr:glycosyltransferase family 1 protein [Agrilactobacillus fermenti]MCD2256335.1 glycosyltransferase family 1 protein [Agrilactobacillus fermenti]
MQDVMQGDIHDYDAILKYFNDRPAKQKRQAHYRSITFVTTGIIPYDGGQTTMLHLGTLLQQAGYEVYYLSYVPQSQASMTDDAEFNFPKFGGTCLDMSHLDTHQSDIWIATMWETAYIIKNKPGYKFYFVQDYEPYFYPFGDRYQLAKKTYDFGLHMVSLGPWCAHMINVHTKNKTPVDQINFPVDLDNYPFSPRDFSNYPTKKRLKIAVYTKWSSPRRAPISIQITMLDCQKLLAKKGIHLDVWYFGTNKTARFVNGTNLGKLTRKEMVDLYNSCDFGIAPSMTNFSLVPFEMMSTGLPFIDFLEGTGSYFLPKGSYFPTHFNETALADTLLTAAQDTELLAKVVATSHQYLHNISWQKTVNDFLKILKRIEA